MAGARALRAVLVTAIVATSLFGSGANARADGVEGCVATPDAPCSYVATTAGSLIAAGGPWKVTINRPDGTVVRHGGEYEVPTMMNTIRAGDRVSAWAGVGPGLMYRKAGVVRVGNDLRSEGCTHTSWGTPCVYQATRSGGIVAAGGWWAVRIERNGKTLVYEQGGSLWGTHVFRKPDAIRKGDLVWVRSDVGFVGTGPDYNY